MYKFTYFIFSLGLILLLFIVGMLIADRAYLDNNLILLELSTDDVASLSMRQKNGVRSIVENTLSDTLDFNSNLERIVTIQDKIMYSVEELVNGPCNVNMSFVNYETQILDDIILPAGEYLTVHISFGSSRSQQLAIFNSNSLFDETRMQKTLSSDNENIVTVFLLSLMGKL